MSTVTKKAGSRGRLTEREQEYLRHSLGRIPTEYEQLVVAHIWHEFYQWFPYADMIRRNQTAQDEILTSENSILKLDSDYITEINGNNSLKNLPVALHDSVLNMLLKRWLPSTAIIGGNLIENESASLPHIIRKLERQYGDLDLRIIPGRSYLSGEKDSADLMVLGVPAQSRVGTINPSQGILVAVDTGIYRKSGSATTIAQRKNIIKALRLLIEKPWIIRLADVSTRNCINDIIDFLINNGVGIEISLKDVSPDDMYDRLFSIERLFMVQIQAGYEHELLSLLSDFSLTFQTIGHIKEDLDFTVTNNGEILVHIPATLYNPDVSLIEEYSTLFTPEETERQTGAISEVKYGEDYNLQLLDLMAYITDRNIGQPARIISSDITNSSILFDIGQNQSMTALDPQLSVTILIAKMVRRMACNGGKANGITAYILCNQDLAADNLLNFSQVIRGISSACHQLGLQQLSIYSGPVKITQQYSPTIGLIGSMSSNSEPVTTVFKDSGDFISILGSLRGELGGSKYMQVFHNSSAGVLPTLDFGMERRLQETIIQGIEGKFVKSAYSIGRGGLVAAIANNLVYAQEELGARVHLSRKLLPAELLFGESQGVVLITLGENDLMEFERICMNVGVPSTTIGRVTDDGRFTFNDLIDLPVSEIRSRLPGLTK